MSDNHKSPSRTVFMVRDLSFGFPGQHTSDRHEIFSGLNLSLHEGCVTSLIGANGSGKSTLLNLITKGLTPNRGISIYGDLILQIFLFVILRRLLL